MTSPTLISTFEILFTPQFPPALSTIIAVEAIDEVVVKGYFLSIANPNAKAYTFRLGFHCNSTTAKNFCLADAIGFYDLIDNLVPNPTQLKISPTTIATNYSATFTLGANATALIGILPSFLDNKGNLLSPANIECRGWVDITLPALLAKPKSVEFVAQSATPITVILTAEQRLTFLPKAGAGPATVESQSAFALPLATGASAVVIHPQPGGIMFFPDDVALEGG